jgi:FMN phosphatase YigB (HAD superfamily)
MIDYKLRMRLANRALEPFGVTMQELEAKDGIIEVNGKRAVYWWQRYFWEDSISYEKWEQWCLQEISKAYPEEDTRDLFEEFAMHYALPQPYLFKEPIICTQMTLY